jgi:hypothetical protein
MAIDILGPLPRTDNGNIYIMVVGDYFTKWMVAIPIPDAEAKTVADKFVERIVSIFGVPLQIHSADNLPNNKSTGKFNSLPNIIELGEVPMLSCSDDL